MNTTAEKLQKARANVKRLKAIRAHELYEKYSELKGKCVKINRTTFIRIDEIESVEEERNLMYVSGLHVDADLIDKDIYRFSVTARDFTEINIPVEESKFIPEADFYLKIGMAIVDLGNILDKERKNTD